MKICGESLTKNLTNLTSLAALKNSQFNLTGLRVSDCNLTGGTASEYELTASEYNLTASEYNLTASEYNHLTASEYNLTSLADNLDNLKTCGEQLSDKDLEEIIDYR